ncbi:ADP-ribosylglycohydrolase family protein [Streptomyces sp. ISL-43]|uniref:ADP-ribosylglycohydrolase family protein n=1 Tax=Streptomyces sp. ISL-43 TaxID=2819183 RepID=UPI001BEAA2A5|nr:ADP-ribosylglycohydrolase family protein [Streptomyces sp. ISL-43]MBT2448407.1 ADP-ribosylglycohydrolase family protein [Streptomyces sp. ISL-43]
MTPTCANPADTPTHPPTTCTAPAGTPTHPPATCGEPVRLTWVQPEDLVGHEFRQAEQDGRADAAEPLLRVWLAAGGHTAPARAGASAAPAPPELRALAADVLTALAALPRPSAATEPDSWPGITATWPEDTGPGPEAVAGPAAAQWPAPAAPGTTAAGPAGPGPDTPLRRRLEAAWVGRAVGCVLGKPVEKLPLGAIRALARAAGNWPLDDWFTAEGVPAELLAAHPWNRRSAATSLAENIDGTPEDDDLNYPLLGLVLLRRHGKRFTTADVGRLWLDELPAGRTFTAERVAYRNLLQGLEPPLTATHHNPFREWIGALIRADVHGWTNPGAPAAAAAQAYRDAALTHTGNGVYAALFVAAATAAAATGRADVHTALRAGLAVVPPRSRLAEAVRFGIRTAARETDFDTVVDHLHARFGHYHWVHAVPNTALISAALTHADGDFTHSICRAVSGGWDTDSNGATAGALAGLLAGSPENIPHRWTAPLKDRLATTVPGFDGIGFDTLAHLTAQEAARS